MRLRSPFRRVGECEFDNDEEQAKDIGRRGAYCSQQNAVIQMETIPFETFAKQYALLGHYPSPDNHSSPARPNHASPGVMRTGVNG
jgi:hypothetical protein